MVIKTRVNIGGIDFVDYQNIFVSKTIGDYNATSSFNVVYDSPYGRHANDFQVGKEVNIFVTPTGEAESTLFTGILESINFEGEENTQQVILEGRDYSARLLDSTVEPVVYTNQEVSDIVADIVTDNVIDITTTNVSGTDITLPRKVFNHTRVFDAIQDLASISNYIFYVDNDKDLNFKPRQSVSQNLNLGSENVINMQFDTTREQMANKIWVYGDRYFSAVPRELFGAGATPGSVYTLTYNPFNTAVQTSNITPGSNLKGGVFSLTSVTPSGADYLVNFHDRQIIFVSGTNIGYSTIPNVNGSVIVNYDRQLPIVKYGQDDTSIILFGPKSDVIIDKSIKDPTIAVNILQSKLLDANPLRNVKANIRGWTNITPGNTVTINMPNLGINNSGISIIEARYDFNRDTVMSENPITLTLSKKPYDITDELKDLNNRLSALESSDLQESDFITRLFSSKESITMVGSRWNFYARWNGSEFRVWPSSNVPPLGSNFTPRLGLLVSGDIGHASWVGSVSYLISGTFGTLQLFFTGGNNYDLTGSYNPNGSEVYLPGGGFF